jgi:hypothetical protein
LEAREWKLRIQIIREFLIMWRGLPVEEGEQILGREDCNILFPMMTICMQ